MRNLEKRVFNTYYTSTDGSLGYYLNEISKYKILPDYETKKEILKAQKGDKRASDKVVNSNQRFIFSIAKRFCNGDKDLLKDLIDEANIGLIKAIESFDCNKNNTFLTYAVYWIQRQMFLYLTFVEPIVKISNKSKTSKVSEIQNRFMVVNGRMPTNEEILNELLEKYGIEINNENDLYQITKTSIDSSVITDNYDDFSSYFGESTSDGDFNFTNKNDYDESSEKEYTKTLVNSSMGALTDKERKVIEMLYGINNYREYEIQEVAEKMKMSKEGVRLINKRALNKLKEEISQKQFSI